MLAVSKLLCGLTNIYECHLPHQYADARQLHRTRKAKLGQCKCIVCNVSYETKVAGISFVSLLHRAHPFTPCSEYILRQRSLSQLTCIVSGSMSAKRSITTTVKQRRPQEPHRSETARALPSTNNHGLSLFKPSLRSPGTILSVFLNC